MTNNYYNGGRRIYNTEDTEDTENKKVVVDSKMETKTKTNPKKDTVIGSGIIENKGSENKKSVTDRIPNIEKLERYVLQYIIGQDKQVRQIITAIYRAINFKSIKCNILVIGNSGTGKTETIKQIAKRLNIPYTIEDATKYTQEGYYGADVNEMIYNLLENADFDIKKARNGIIVIDEIDKKVGHEEHDVSGTEVLKSLLKIIEGTIIKIPSKEDSFDSKMIDFDTKNIIIIFLGAFSGLEKIRDKRLNTNPLGFTTGNVEYKEKLKSRFLKKDLVEFGMPEEFVGRIDTIVEMNKLTRKDLSLILKKSKLSIFKKYQMELRKKGILLSYDRKLFDCIAEESLTLDTGARELSNTVNYIFENIMYDIFANPEKYHKCTLDLDIVHDNTKYQLS